MAKKGSLVINELPRRMMLAGRMANRDIVFHWWEWSTETVTIVVLSCLCKERGMDLTQLSSRSRLEDLTSLPIPIRSPYRLHRIVLFLGCITYIEQIEPPHPRGVS